MDQPNLDRNLAGNCGIYCGACDIYCLLAPATRRALALSAMPLAILLVRQRLQFLRQGSLRVGSVCGQRLTAKLRSAPATTPRHSRVCRDWNSASTWPCRDATRAHLTWRKPTCSALRGSGKCGQTSLELRKRKLLRGTCARLRGSRETPTELPSTASPHSTSRSGSEISEPAFRPLYCVPLEIT
jgi:hypothetical protein